MQNPYEIDLNIIDNLQLDDKKFKNQEKIKIKGRNDINFSLNKKRRWAEITYKLKNLDIFNKKRKYEDI